jgi:DMSO/TMAO reductase YedYZ heme-binding membrane subunit
MSGTTAFWYASRATGIVALLLLTAVLVLGILVNRQGRLPGLPRFAVTSLHRNISLLAVAFVAVHVLTAVLDTYVSIPLASAVVPFDSGYERLWLGLGAISFDLMLAMIITSLIRGRLNRILWRAIHLLAYLCWPVAFAHSIGSSKDLQHGWLLYLAVGCAVVVVAATGWRLAQVARQVPRAARVAAIFAKHSATNSTTTDTQQTGNQQTGNRQTGNKRTGRPRETV